MEKQPPPLELQQIGDMIAIRWADNSESYLPFEYLRKNSPSAENIGEKDIFGNQYGGDGPKSFPGVTVTGWSFVGNYAVAFNFSDGHSSGIYSWPYLKAIADKESG